jgi:hypothetical protein
MTDMVLLHLFLGLEISHDSSGIKLSQAKYARDLLERFHMTDYKSSPTPFLSGVILEDGVDTPLDDGTLYIHLVGRACCISHTTNQTSPMQLEQSASSCKSHMSYIGRMQSISFNTYRAPSPLGFTM